MRIDEHKKKAVALINGDTIACNDLVMPTPRKLSEKDKKDKEVEGVITKIHHIFWEI